MVVKFSAGLCASVSLVAVVDNVQHVDRIRVQVTTTLHPLNSVNCLIEVDLILRNIF